MTTDSTIHNVTSTNTRGHKKLAMPSPDGSLIRVEYEPSHLTPKGFPVQTITGVAATSDAGTEYVVTIRRVLQPVGGKVAESFVFDTAAEYAERQKSYELQGIAYKMERDREALVRRGQKIASMLRELTEEIERTTRVFDNSSKSGKIRSSWDTGFAASVTHDVMWKLANLGLDSLVSDEAEFRLAHELFLRTCTSDISAQLI